MSRLRWLGGLSAFVGLAHDANHLRRGEPHDLLWTCNVAPLVLAAGCLLRRPRLVAVAALWLGYGTPLWGLDLASGGELIWTSFGPHMVCLVAGWLALRELGLPRLSWLAATAGLVALFALTRLLTAPAHNVNLAFAVRAGWEQHFPRHQVYLALIVSTAAASFLVLETLAGRLLPRRT